MKRRDRPAPRFSKLGQPAPTSDVVRPATGASGAHWGSLHDAWQDAADARPGRSSQGKEPLPHGVLHAIVQHRLLRDPMLRQALEHEPKLRSRIDALQKHARDAQGRNWDISTHTGGSALPAVYEPNFRCIVDAMRDQFDLA